MSRYNSAVLVSPQGNVLANYRKSFLYTTDETWAEEGPGFYVGDIPGGSGKMSMGICASPKLANHMFECLSMTVGMDLNPKQFIAPFDKYEFANHVLDTGSDLVVMPMAWLTTQPPESIVEQAQVPDADTLSYWIQRLKPILDNGPAGLSEEMIFVTCNRIGIEGDAVYAGTSAIVGITKGNVKVYGCLGRGTEDLLVCDVPGEKFGGMDPSRGR
jgi:protein N-terminal amidase